jgi:hypothetical protein
MDTLDQLLLAEQEIMPQQEDSIDINTSGMYMECNTCGRYGVHCLYAKGTFDQTFQQNDNIWDPKPIGSSGSGFGSNNQNNLSNNINLGNLTNDNSLNDYALEERYDLSGHNDLNPHLNQDIIDESAPLDNGGFKSIINSGTSKKNSDGYKGLGFPHNIGLFDD